MGFLTVDWSAFNCIGNLTNGCFFPFSSVKYFWQLEGRIGFIMLKSPNKAIMEFHFVLAQYSVFVLRLFQLLLLLSSGMAYFGKKLLRYFISFLCSCRISHGSSNELFYLSKLFNSDSKACWYK